LAEVCVLGLGYIGLPTASLLANAGFRVLGVDIDHAIVEALRSGRTRMEESGLATLVSAAVQSGNLVASRDPEPSDTFIICVQTPLTEEKKVDLSAVEAAVRAIIPHLRPGNLVILESTSPVGTTRNVVGRILKESGLDPGRDFDLCYCPERVLPGNTLSELVNNDRIIGGYTAKSAERASAIYERLCQGKILLTDDRTAEMCKLMENIYRDVNIALANVFARISEESGVDVWKAIEYANHHPRVNILKPGPGVGGHCIPVDPWFLVEAYPEHTSLLRRAREVNEGQSKRILNRMMNTGQLGPGDKLAILGAAYKADIDDPRESPALLIANLAVKKGIKVHIHDPLVKPGAHHGFEISNDLAACLENAAAAALMTEHRAYRDLSAEILSEHMTGRLIFDSRNWLDHNSLRHAGFTVIVTGTAELKFM